MNENRGNSEGIVIVGVLCAIVIGAAVTFYQFMYTPTTSAAAKPEEVVLSGTVTTNRTAATPQNITFTSMSDGTNYVAACEGGGNPADYSITLPNEDTYQVTISSKVFGLIYGGAADAGTLTLDETKPSLAKDWED
jgi:hypothetical protein